MASQIAPVHALPYVETFPFRVVSDELDPRNPSRELVLERGASWSGRVLDPDGRAIEQCTVVLRKADGRLSSAECSRSGFAFTVLPPGKTEASVILNHHALGAWRHLAQTITIEAHERRRADIRWPAGASIAGTVVDAQGVPIAGRRLDALPHAKAPLDNRLDDDEIQVETDAAGHFELRHLRPGVWTIRASRDQPGVDVATGTRDVRLTSTR